MNKIILVCLIIAISISAIIAAECNYENKKTCQEYYQLCEVIEVSQLITTCECPENIPDCFKYTYSPYKNKIKQDCQGGYIQQYAKTYEKDVCVEDPNYEKYSKNKYQDDYKYGKEYLPKKKYYDEYEKYENDYSKKYYDEKDEYNEKYDLEYFLKKKQYDENDNYQKEYIPKKYYNDEMEDSYQNYEKESYPKNDYKNQEYYPKQDYKQLSQKNAQDLNNNIGYQAQYYGPQPYNNQYQYFNPFRIFQKFYRR